MFENTEWLPGRDSHMLPFGEQRGDKSFVFTLQMFRQLHLDGLLAYLFIWGTKMRAQALQVSSELRLGR